MKNKASGFLKQVITVLTAMAKSKTLALKRKTDALRTRIIIYSLLRNRKFMMSTISHKLNALLHQDDKKLFKEDNSDQEEQSDDNVHCSNNAIMSYESLPNPAHTETLQEENLGGYEGRAEEKDYQDEHDKKYPDLTHSLFDDDDFEDPGGSVIDIVKNSKQNGEEFRLEDEIDRVADLFIKRFHRQIRIQRQQSMKKYQDILEKSA